jgi:AAA domain
VPYKPYDVIPGSLPSGHKQSWNTNGARRGSNGHGGAPRPPLQIEVNNAGKDPDPSEIAPREWLMATIFCCEFISGLIGEGGTGKTALRLLQLISLAIDRALTGHKVFARCKVLIVCLEDSRKEFQRRVGAVRVQYNIPKEELDGWLYYITLEDLKGAKLAVMGQNGPERGELADVLEGLITDLGIDIVSIDPTIKAHELNENQNKDMDFLCDILSDIAIRLAIAADLPMHQRKGTKEPGDADSGRGASSVKDAGRLIYTLTKMSLDEAKAYDIKPDERKRYIRMDSAKVNLTAGTEPAMWYKLIGVKLGNKNERYPAGDEIQTVEIWNPPETWADLSNAALNAALDAIEMGLIDDETKLPTGQRYTAAGRATDRAAWKVIQRSCPSKNETQCREIVSTWVRNGVLREDKYEDPIERKKLVGLFVVPTKRPGMETRE